MIYAWVYFEDSPANPMVQDQSMGSHKMMHYAEGGWLFLSAYLSPVEKPEVPGETSLCGASLAWGRDNEIKM